MMAPHQQRVVNEKNELDEKRAKLEVFFLTDIFQSLPEEEKGRLTRQAGIMHDYSKILGERIAAFE